LTEQPKGDWAITVLRQYLFSQFQYLLFEQIQKSNDVQLAAIATKSIKETAYHVRWSKEWVIRLGDGTELSQEKILHALEELWPYTGEMFIAVEYETEIDLAVLKELWKEKVTTVFDEAKLPVLENVFMQTGGKTGTHTEHLGFILAEMQYLQRTYPGAEW
jgi:ring-1,2-phenylacetyl-CoA epoxidase subunit PaaC